MKLHESKSLLATAFEPPIPKELTTTSWSWLAGQGSGFRGTLSLNLSNGTIVLYHVNDSDYGGRFKKAENMSHLTFWIWCLEVDIWRDGVMFKRQCHLDHTGEHRRSFTVAEIGFHL